LSFLENRVIFSQNLIDRRYFYHSGKKTALQEKKKILADAKADAGQPSRMETHISEKMGDKLKAGLFDDLLRDFQQTPGEMAHPIYLANSRIQIQHPWFNGRGHA
jgi:hypothetical protein